MLLYSCPTLTDGCSSCLGLNLANGFECGWCDRPSGMTGTCSFAGDCPSQNLVSSGSQCPNPTITDFFPMAGPPEGGTTITINGRELGVTFDDFAADSIRIGTDQNSVPCTPTDRVSYISGRQIRCITSGGSTTESKRIAVSIGSRNGESDMEFRVVSPRVTGVFPSLGPQAGGTQVTVYGTDLNIGNRQETNIILVGTECPVKYVAEKLPCIFTYCKRHMAHFSIFPMLSSQGGPSLVLSITISV